MVLGRGERDVRAEKWLLGPPFLLFNGKKQWIVKI
jgi:hypothetical protein